MTTVDFHMHTTIENTAEEEEAFANMQEALPLSSRAESYSQDAVCIYHAGCADGFSAAWVFWKANQLVKTGLNLTFHEGVYGEAPPDVEGKVVFLVDFSYKRQVIKDMIDLGGADQVIIIDHHVSAMKDLAGLDDELYEEWKIANAEKGDVSPEIDYYEQLTLQFNMEKSGCMLAWEYWQDEFEQVGYSRPILLDHIEDRDLWKFKLPLTKELSASIFSYEYTFENWDLLMSSNIADKIALAEIGEALLRKHNKDVRGLLAATETVVNIGGYNVPCANLPHIYASDAGHIMATRPENATSFAATYYDSPTHRVFSLRSAKDTGEDVSKIAGQYGGGGHKNAAGFKVSLFPEGPEEADRMPYFGRP